MKGSLEARIYEIFPRLTMSEKRLADVFLEFQMDLPSYTAGELAEKAKVSKSTAARLIRTLGYDSYPEAKRQIRNDQHWGSPFASTGDVETSASGQVSIQRMMNSDLDNIHRTISSISEALLEDVCRALVTARRVWIMGLRSGYGLAFHTGHYFSMVRPDVQVLPAGGGSFSHEIASIGRDDVLLVIAFRRRPQLLPTLLDEVRSTGATTILLTDLSAAASARASAHVLRCHCHSPSPFNSFSAAVTLINYLAWRMGMILGENGMNQYRRIDRLVRLIDNVSTPQRDKSD